MGIRSFLFLVIHSLPIVLTEMLLIFSNLPLTDMRQSVVLVMPFPTACNESFHFMARFLVMAKLKHA